MSAQNKQDIWLLQGCCLDRLRHVPDASVDMVMCDPPYGTIACNWDVAIPLAPLWEHLKRVIKPRGAIVLTGCQPFTSVLVSSNLGMYRTSWVWDKKAGANFANARRHPLKVHEDVVVFGKKATAYYPQMVTGRMRTKSAPLRTDPQHLAMRADSRPETRNDQYYPKSILSIKRERGLHPTQKPVELMRYLVATYTRPREIVLDFAMGSGTTGVACLQLDRRFIGIEKNAQFFMDASRRLLEL